MAALLAERREDDVLAFLDYVPALREQWRREDPASALHSSLLVQVHFSLVIADVADVYTCKVLEVNHSVAWSALGEPPHSFTASRSDAPFLLLIYLRYYSRVAGADALEIRGRCWSRPLLPCSDCRASGGEELVKRLTYPPLPQYSTTLAQCQFFQGKRQTVHSPTAACGRGNSGRCSCPRWPSGRRYARTAGRCCRGRPRCSLASTSSWRSTRCEVRRCGRTSRPQPLQYRSADKSSRLAKQHLIYHTPDAKEEDIDGG